MNKIILASAGAGKTTRIVNESIVLEDKKILITTFTNENTESIKNKFVEIYGHIPVNISIMPWFTFLLNDIVRPYQSCCKKNRVKNMILVSGKSTTYEKKGTSKYYFSDDKTIYSDKIVEFGLLCNEKTNGSVINRLIQLYEVIYVDEIQDLGGYDLDFVELLLSDGPQMILVGDLRQATFSTNMSARYKKYKGANTLGLFEYWGKIGLCEIEHMSHSYRCSKDICKLSDSLFEKGMFEETRNLNDYDCEHLGIYLVNESDLDEYIVKYHPKVLRQSIKQSRQLDNEMNIGQSKGLTFNRVLILTTGPMVSFLKSGNVIFKPRSLSLLYVAITRAKYSVAFVIPNQFESKIPIIKQYRSET